MVISLHNKAILPMYQKGIIQLLPLLLLAIVIVGGVYLYSQGILKIPSLSLQKKPTVELQTAYQNPFDKGSQYVNPFSGYKNPFDNLK